WMYQFFAALTDAQQQGQAVACVQLNPMRGKDDPHKIAYLDVDLPVGTKLYPQPMQQGGGEVCAEDLRWCEDIAESLQEAGGPTNNMRLVALNRLLRHARTAPPSAPVGVEGLADRI